MALTQLQKDRIRFHLGYSYGTLENSILEIENRLSLNALPAEVELALIGDLAVAEGLVLFEGEPLASSTSMLGKVENAFSNLSPDVIDPSLFVESAGKVKLRGTELRKREQLYDWLRHQLAALLGTVVKDGFSGRVGYTRH